MRAGQEFAGQIIGGLDERRNKPIVKLGNVLVMVESAQSFGKYTLLEKVAVGGMAEIYLAKTQGLGGFEKVLAIKRLHPQFGEKNDVAQMLIDEARIAVHLTHPNIAQIFDLGCIDGQYFIAMEYIDGVDLHQVNKRVRERGGQIPDRALVFVMAEALSGLHYAHTRTDARGKPLQIVHRDVSPQNIMISYEGEVKIVDFGIAKAESRAQEDTQHGIIKGKFYYMSPEQAHGHHLDARTDIFAAGMVLYELLAGQNPYTRIEDFELLKAVRKADFPPLSSVCPEIDPDLAEIVSRATQRNVNYRYETARAMQMDLMAYLDRNHGPYRRMKLADFVRGVSDRPNVDGQHPSDDSAAMSRDDFAASDASMIFEAGSGLTDAGSNPFVDEEPTLLWTPDAPKPLAVAYEASRKETDRPSEQASPNLGGTSDLGASGAVHEPKASTQEASPPLGERLIASDIQRTRVIFGVLALLVVGLVGVLTYLLMVGGEPHEATAKIVDARGDTADVTQPTAVSRTPLVDVRITSTPSGAEIHLDGVPKGHTPGVLEQLSTGKSYELMLSLPGARTLERTIQPTRETAELEFELPESGAVLKIATYPPNAQIKVDGESAGRSPIDVPGLARSAQHEVVATLDDGRELTRTVSWDSGDGRVKQVELQFVEAGETEKADEAGASGDEAASARSRTPEPRRTKRRSTRRHADNGHLSVRIEGKGKVYVDGELVADDTSSFKHSLEAGIYSVRVYFSRLKRHSPTKRIRVRGGETSNVSFAP